jgi:peptide/nickel transport system substrate-binding protein
MLGESVVLDSYLPPEHPLFNPNVPKYEFDVEKGTALLEQAGWIDGDDDPETPRVASGVEGITNGTPLEFNYWIANATQRDAAAQKLQASLAKCGVKVNVEYWDRSEFIAPGPDGPLFGRSFDIGQFAWLTGVEPRCDLYVSSQIPSAETEWDGLNVSGFVNEEYDAACSAALQSLPGQPEYEQYHLETQRIFAEQLPVVPLYLRLELVASRLDMIGLSVDPTESEMWNIEKFDYGD